MIDKIREDIVDRITKIETGSFTHDDVRLLFIDLRDSIPEEKPPNPLLGEIYDLFTFAAHPNMRERGAKFKVAESIKNQFLTSITSGGSVQIRILEFKITDYIKKILDIYSIPYSSQALENQENALMLHTYQILDGVELDMNDARVEVARIEFELGTKTVYFSHKVKPFDNMIGSLNISGSPTMKFRLM